MLGDAGAVARPQLPVPTPLLTWPLDSWRSHSPSRPNLVSLDLSFNDLTDLQGTVAGLRTLRHLRLLVLQGNPLALVPCYRGFVIDSLSGLCVLDDITVASSEKHLFRGLSHSGGEGADVQGRAGREGDLLARPSPYWLHVSVIQLPV